MDRSLLELGPMISPESVGAEVALMVPISRAYRLGGTAMVNTILRDHDQLVAAMAELRHVGLDHAGRGRHHWDIGPVAGYAFVAQHPSDATPFVGARIAFAFQAGSLGTSLALVPVVFAPDSQTADPGVYASWRVEIPL